MLGYLGIRPEQQVYTHCGGGIAASVPFFAAKFMLDYPKVKLYKESQLEWLRDDRGLPFWTYDAPNLTREKTWLNAWGNQMMRSFGVAKLSVVDVRPAASFKQAHVPFAINVPADVFKRHLATPAKLAEVLGAAGVDVANEAVIVSEGGLNPDSALAFLMLEKLGQKRVSVLSDSVDDWGFAGFPLSKETDAADPKKAPPGLLDLSDGIRRQSPPGHRDQRFPGHQGAVSQGLHRFRQVASRQGARREGHSCALHRPSECQRNAQGRERYLEHPREGRRPAICRDRSAFPMIRARPQPTTSS